MRLPLQITLGQALVVLFPLAVGLLGISSLLDLERTVERVSSGIHEVSEAADDLHLAMVRHETARHGGQPAAQEAERLRFQAVLESLRGSTAEWKGATALILDLEESAERFFSGNTPLEDMLGVVRARLRLEREVISAGERRCQDVARGGTGLIVAIGAIGLAAGLLFGYWLTRKLAYPLEKVARATEALARGELQVRTSQAGAVGAVARLSAGIDHLADRILRLEADRRLEYVLVSAAAERLLEPPGWAAGVLTPGRRLVVAGGRARERMEARGLDLDRLADEASAAAPGSVERTPVRTPGGEPLGEILRIRVPESSAVRSDS